jgi:Short C-terminal domain/Phospholipase_D-nuclease N-terminal
MSGYPLLDVFWTMMWFFLWITWFYLLLRVFTDVFRSTDLGGWRKALWIVFVVVLPYLGVLIYFIARGSDMQRRDAAHVRAQDAAFRDYVQGVAGTSDGKVAGSADELGKLAALRDQGVLTDVEFAAQKTKVLA